MDDRASSKAYLAAGAVAVLLVAAHFLLRDEDEASARREKPSREAVAAAVDEQRAAGAERDAQLREEFREKMRPAFADGEAERAQKEFARGLSHLGNNPVEVADGDLARVDGLKELRSDAEIEAFVAQGGHYSGWQPSAEELELQAAAAKQGGGK